MKKCLCFAVAMALAFSFCGIEVAFAKDGIPEKETIPREMLNGDNAQTQGEGQPKGEVDVSDVADASSDSSSECNQDDSLVFAASAAADAFGNDALSRADMGRTVYVSRTGSRYHYRSNCSNMTSPRSMSLQEAVNRGYTACAVCVRENPDPDPVPDPDPGPPPVSKASRLYGETAAETSVKISLEGFTSANTVVIAREDDFRDAMSAAGLAGCFDAPILLTDRHSLSSATASEVRRLGASRAFVIGGTGAVKPEIDAQLKAAGILEVVRVFGEEAWDTSVACAKIIKENGGAVDKVIVAMSINFQDALSISPFAYRYKVPIYLQTSSGDRPLPTEAVSLIGETESSTIYVPGGIGAVKSSTVEGVFGAGRVVRLYGTTGYDTSERIADYMVSQGLLSPDISVVACGAQSSRGVDALAGAALAGKRSSVLLLATSNTAMEPTNTVAIDGYLARWSFRVDSVFVLGGTYVMPQPLFNKIDWIAYNG